MCDEKALRSTQSRPFPRARPLQLAKPLDASDVANLEEAKADVVRMRALIRDLGKQGQSLDDAGIEAIAKKVGEILKANPGNRCCKYFDKAQGGVEGGREGGREDEHLDAAIGARPAQGWPRDARR